MLKTGETHYSFKRIFREGGIFSRLGCKGSGSKRFGFYKGLLGTFKRSLRSEFFTRRGKARLVDIFNVIHIVAKED